MSSARNRRGRPVQRVDGYYLYRVGYQLHQLSQLSGGGGIFGGESTKYVNARQQLYVAEAALVQLLYNSIFNLRTSVQTGEALLVMVQQLKEKVSGDNDADKELEFFDVFPLQQVLGNFEQVLQAELALVPLYIVTRKGAFDTGLLIEAGRVIFPDNLEDKAPEAISDIEQGTRCIAFALPTAAGFHFHRANESVLKRYWDAVSGGMDRPDSNNMGVYLAAMDKEKIGDDRVKASLRDLKDFHRNPLIHPDHSLETTDEAVALMNAVQSAVTNMLKAIPDPI